MSTAKISNIIHNKQLLTTVSKREKTTVPTVNCKGYKCSVEQVDVMIEDAMAAGVLNPRMRAWYCKAAYKLGSEVFMRCVSQAKTGNHPPKLFSYLVNKALTDSIKKAQAAGSSGNQH